MNPRRDREKILVVDDQPENIYILIENLEEDYEIMFATNGKKALNIAFSEDRPDLILLDILMPEMDGYEVCTTLRAASETRDIPIIFITASEQQADEAKGLQLGAVDFIAKPFKMPIVEARIKTALRLKAEMDRRMALARKLEDLNRHLEERIEEKARELELTHENLKTSESKYRAIYENAMEGIFQTTIDGRLLSVSPSLAHILGYVSPDEIISTVTDIDRRLYVRSEDRERFRHTLEQEGEISGFETQFRKKNGDIIDVMVSAKAIRDENGELLHFQGFNIDISERKRAETALRKSVAHLRTLVETIPDLIWLKDPEGIYLSCNQKFERFFGAKEKDIIGKTDYDFVDKKLADFFREKDRAALAAGRSIMNEEEVTFADDGHKEMLETIKTPMFDSDGKLIGVLGIARDLTERRLAEKEKARVEDQYRQAQKVEAIGRLAGGVAHDLNNLLTPILGYGELLFDEFGPSDPRKRKIEQIVQAGLRARDLVRQLLTFSRKQPLMHRSVNMSKAVSGFEKLMRRTIREHIEIKTILSPDIPPVKADIGQIEQVIMNLAVNAADAMPTGGCLTIETASATLEEVDTAIHPETKPGKYVMLNVSDTGCGMDNETLKHLFEPFFSTKGELGTGLGLATVYGIIKQHGGLIRVRSELGKGSIFKIFLPVSVDKREEEKTSEQLNSGLKGFETILLVEDSEHVRDLAHDVLKRQGYRVLAAKHGAEALDLLASHNGPVHLLLTDVIMPGLINGKELFARTAQFQPGLKVLYMSGYTDDIITHQGILNDGVQFIQKPFTVLRLTTKVREVLEQK
jgi:PAS domain S-box-containing protein